MQELRQSTEVKVRVGSAVDAADGVTPETGLTLGAADQAELLKHNGAATVDISAATFAAVTAVDGWYDLTLTASYTDTLGQLTAVVQDSSLMAPIFRDFMVVNANYWDSKYSTDKLEVDMVQCGGSIVAAGAIPNAAADAIGGLPVSDLGGLDLDAILEDTNNLQTNQSAWATAVGFSTHSAADVKTAIEAAGSSIATILTDTTTDIPALIGDVPTVAEFNARTLPTADYITVADILDAAIEGAYTMREVMRVASAVMGGVSSGAGTDTMVFRDLNDTKDRVTATLTEDGDRIVVVINAA